MTVFESSKGDVAKEALRFFNLVVSDFNITLLIMILPPGPAFNYLENARNRFDDGPFLLGQFSSVDIAYIPFVERFQIFLTDVFKYDITVGKPKFAAWIE
ncbi:hypothetical protein ACFE04_031678 [Oxalis oulophora]